MTGNVQEEELASLRSSVAELEAKFADRAGEEGAWQEEMETVKRELSSTQERVTQLEEENRELREENKRLQVGRGREGGRGNM